ncbi:MAG TPA: signal peptidase I [Thermoanaerobaculia bacterium]|nr:signal peptidase I [Thermoanaerobaculia bacterium]
MPGPKSTLRLIIEPVAVAVALALAVRGLVRIYAIPSSSMAPTLRVGDHIVVTPFHAPFWAREPVRGDVIAFRSPRNSREIIVKRVIATAGDLVSSSNGRVLIGGHGLPEPYLADPASSGSIQPQIIPSGCYFVMGDNRADSFDSRHWGVLPRDLVLGRVRLVLWSSGDGSTQPRASAAPLRTAITPHTPAGVSRILHAVE